MLESVVSVAFAPFHIGKIQKQLLKVENNFQVHHMYNALHPHLDDVERVIAPSLHRYYVETTKEHFIYQVLHGVAS